MRSQATLRTLCAAAPVRVGAVRARVQARLSHYSARTPYDAMRRSSAAKQVRTGTDDRGSRRGRGALGLGGAASLPYTETAPRYVREMGL